MMYFRFWLGRHLIHFGLAVWPDGRCKREVDAALRVWGEQVRTALTTGKGAEQS